MPCRQCRGRRQAQRPGRDNQEVSRDGRWSMMHAEYSIDGIGATDPHVPETRFGLWFLRTGIWAEHVLARAIADLDRLIADRQASYPIIVDVGCGWGRSFKLLQDRFRPDRMIGIDVDAAMLAAAAAEAAKHGLAVEFKRT